MKSIARPIFALVIIIMSLVSCKTTQPIDDIETATNTNIEFKTINSGFLTGNGGEGIGSNEVFVIKSEGDWAMLRAKMNSVNETQKEVSIDFEQTTVLAYFDEIRPSGGYAVEIISVIDQEDGVEVTARFKKPFDAAIEIMTQPFHIVSIPKTKKRVRFISLTE